VMRSVAARILFNEAKFARDYYPTQSASIK
jgi:hypothetical protein